MAGDPTFDPYRELGLSPEAVAEPELIRAAFKALAKKYHPDGYPDAAGKAAAEEKMRKLNEAQRLLLSGEYRPPQRAEVGIAPLRPAPTAPPPGRESARKARKVPLWPLMMASAVLLASLGLPVLLGKDHLQLATSLEQKGLYREALEEANLAVTDNPRDGRAYLLRARLWQKLGQPARAKTDLANARGLVPPLELEAAEEAMGADPSPAPQGTPSPRAPRSAWPKGGG